MSRTITAGGFGHMLASALLDAANKKKLALPITPPEKIINVQSLPSETPQVFIAHEKKRVPRKA